jgi:hypothetical protein
VEAPSCPKCKNVVLMWNAASSGRRLSPQEALDMHECHSEVVEVCCGSAVPGARKCKEKVLLLVCKSCKKKSCVSHRFVHECSAPSVFSASCRSPAGKAAEIRANHVIRVK